MCQFPLSDQRLLTAPVHDFGSANNGETSKHKAIHVCANLMEFAPIHSQTGNDRRYSLLMVIVQDIVSRVAGSIPHDLYECVVFSDNSWTPVLSSFLDTMSRFRTPISGVALSRNRCELPILHSRRAHGKRFLELVDLSK